MFITTFYTFGGLFFLLGSILYFPGLGSNAGTIGTWIFRTGSINYICGSVLSLSDVLKMEVKAQNKYINSKNIWILVLVLYIIGAAFFITGGILS